jgi:glyoxylase-like metal-dependent hydrolase (beta-lactamase superfamily II)
MLKRLYVFDNGMATDVPRESLVSTGAPFDPDDQVSIPFQSFLMETDNGLILYDTGLNPDENHPGPKQLPEEKRLLNCLNRLGYSPDDVDRVICSHLHFDHSGHLLLFPNATVYVGETELKGLEAAHRSGTIGGFYKKEDYEAWMEHRVRFQTVPVSDHPISLEEGVELLSFGPGIHMACCACCLR